VKKDFKFVDTANDIDGKHDIIGDIKAARKPFKIRGNKTICRNWYP